MSTFKFSENLFLGRQELDRFLLFMRDHGFVRSLLANSVQFGIVRNVEDHSFNNSKVVVGGSAGTVDVNAVLAIDSDGNAIFTSESVNLQIPDDGSWHWIKISHAFVPTEKGNVSVDANGNMTGVNTEFTEVLRGQPNFPSKITFPNAINNTGEYEVSSVIDDANAVLQGAFQTESDLEYQVVGTFTPGSFPNESEKYPFQYDGCRFELIAEQNLTPHEEGKEFLLARCKNNGGTVLIEDKRNDIYRAKADWRLSYVDGTANPLIGVEGIHFGTDFSPLNKNAMIMAWGFRSSNWTKDTTLNTITLNGGTGGKYKNTDDFTNGDFDGWRAYNEAGEYSIIKSSVKTGSQINLVLDAMDPLDFANESQELLIVPNVEAILITLEADGETSVPDRTYEFPINEAFKKIYVEVFRDPNCSYKVSYRYRNFHAYSQKRDIPDDEVGYYNEQSYDNNGNLKSEQSDRIRIPYDLGLIIFTLNPDNHKKRLDQIDTGVIFGVQKFQLDNSSPLVVRNPNTNPRYQIINNETTFTLTVDHFINMVTTDVVEGSEIVFDINADISLNGFRFRFVQDYVSTGEIGTVLVELDEFLLEAAKNDKLSIKLTFDGQGTWVPQIFVSSNVLKPINLDDLDESLQNSINSIPNVVDVTVGSNPPSNPTEGDIWIDNS